MPEYTRWRDAPRAVSLRDDGIPGKHPFDPPLERLPPILREAILELAEIQEISVHLATACVLGALSLSAAPFCSVELPIAFRPTLPTALYLVATAGISERKSTSAAIANRGVKRFQDEEEIRFKKTQKAYLESHEQYERERKRAYRAKSATDEQFAALDLESIEQPTKLIAYANSTTKAGLRQAFAQGPGSIGLFAAEFKRVFGTSPQFEELIDDLNSYFSGETNSQLQGGSAGHMSMESASLTLFALGQRPTWDRLEQPITDILRETGLTARILYVDCPPYEKVRSPVGNSNRSTPYIDHFIERTYELLNSNPRIHKIIPFDSAASSLYSQHQEKIENAKTPNSGALDIADILSKSSENAARLASLLSRLIGNEIITAEVFAAATDLMSFFNCHSKRRYGDGALWDDDMEAIKLGYEHLQKFCQARATTKYPYRAWRQIATPMRIRDARRRDMILGYLEALGFIAIRTIEGSKTIVLTNSALHVPSSPPNIVQRTGLEATAVRPVYTVEATERVRDWLGKEALKAYSSNGGT